MIYATFYQYGAITKTELFPACGDRGTIILDGRRSKATNIVIARYHCKDRKYAAFQLHKGPSLMRSKPITQMEKI
jgi:hypothetical protein